MNSIKKLFSFKNVLIVFVVGILIQIVFPEMVFAIGNGESDTLQRLAEVLGAFINVLTFISLLMMNFFGELLGTNLLTGEDAMRAITPMWIWVRNLTNILFVVVLVGLAFSNLYSSFSKEGGGNWTIKEKLPKVIIALVVINFSLIGFKVAIDAINLGTVAILSIADSRLDADNSNLEAAMLKDKTWVIVSDNTWDTLGDKIKNMGDVNDFDKSKKRSGDPCTTDHNNFIPSDGAPSKKLIGFTKLSKDNTEEHYICRDFRSIVNDLFCSNWMSLVKDENGIETPPNQSDLDDDCLFILKKDTFQTILDPKSEPGQNLFMSFGTTFMHLERLPALGAQINSLSGVIMNTLFSAILGIAYLVALVAIFIALLVRVIVIWIALVFSPLLIGALIMGFGGGEGGDISKRLVTNLIMPLKIAAAFAVSFVMMSGMIEFNTVGQNDAFVFGPALSHLGIAERGFMWQIATIVIFWLTAQWAIKGNEAEFITKNIFAGAEKLGEVAARAATIDRQIFSLPTGKKGEKFSMSNILSLPATLEIANTTTRNKGLQVMKKQLRIISSDFEKSLVSKTFTSGTDYMNFSSSAESIDDFNSHRELIIQRLRASTSAPFAAKLVEFAESEDNAGKSMDKISHEFFLKKGSGFVEDYKNEFIDSGHYTGTAGTDKAPVEGDEENEAPVEGGDGGKQVKDNVKMDEGGKGIRVDGDLVKKKALKRYITNRDKVKKVDKTNIEKACYNLQGLQEYREAVGLKFAVVVAGLTLSTVLDVKNPTISTATVNDNDESGIIAVQDRDENNKIKNVQLLTEEQTRIDLTDLGAKKNGRVSSLEVNNVYYQISIAKDEALKKAGITSENKNNVLQELREVKGYDEEEVKKLVEKGKEKAADEE